MNTLFAAILKRHYLVYAFAFSCVLAVSPSGAQTVDLDFIMSNYNVQIKASAVDASGNIIVTGTYYSSTVFTYDFDPGAGVVAPFQNNINTAVPVNFIAKYTSAGAFVWLIDGYNDATVAANEISDVHVDSNNNIYVVGSSSGGPVTFRDKSTPGINTAVGGTFLTNTNLYGAYVIKFNSSGIKQWSWNRATSGSLVDFYGKGIKTDASGNVFVAGTYSNASFQTTGAVWKLNSSGVQQSQNFVTSVGSEINDVAIDGAGNVYVTGIFKNTVDFDATAATQNITADANGDVFVAKYSSAFGYVWATKLTTTSSQDIGKKIVLDGSGNVFVLGKGGANQLLLNKVNTSGTSIASFALTSSTSFDPHHLKISSSNNIYVSGSKVGSTDFDPGAGTISGTSKYLAKYSNALAFQYVYGLGDVMSSGTALAINSQDKLVTADSYLSNSRVIVLSEDVTPPTINAFSPLDGATGVAITANLVATFSENVTPVASKVVSIKRSSDNAVFESYTLPSANVSVSGSTVTINPTGSLVNSTGYYVTMDAGAFQDVSGNAFAGITNTTTWNFTTVAAADVTPPTISSLLPADGATGVAVASNLVATFSESVVAVASKVVSIKYAGGEVPGGIFESYTLPSANVTVSGNTVTINPTSNLANLAEYYVNIETGAFIDAAGNPFAGISNATSWNFTAVPASAPIVTAFYPVNNATNVPVGVNSFFIAFDDFIQVNQSALGTVQLKKLDGTVVFETTAPNISTCCQNVPFYMGEAVLEPATTYYFNIGNDIFRKSGGVSYYTGISNNTAWRFTTGSVNSVISSFLPARGATSVSTSLGSIKMYFSSQVYDSYGYYRLRKVSDNSLVKQWDVYADITYGYDAQAGLYFAELPLSNALEAGTSYYIDNQFNNAGGNEPGWMEYDFAYNEPEDIWTTARIVPWATNFWTFTTVPAADVTHPTITSLSPADNATGVAVNGNLIVTFSENIVANTGVITIRDIGGSMHSSYSVNGGVTIANNTLTITPSYDLSASTEYYVDLGVGVVKDAAGNLFAGLNGNPNWTFTTQALQVSALSYAPVNSSTNVPVSSNLSITFDENMTISVGTISLYRVSNGSLITSLSNFNGSEMSINGATITFDMPNDLPANTEVYVNVSSGYLRSAVNGQKIWPGIQDNTTWRFTTGKLDQTVTFNALPAKAFGEAPFALTATASSGLAVSYASSNTSVATVSGSTVTIVGVGSSIITASQAGNASYSAASNVPQTLTVNKASQTITFAALPAKTFGDANFTLGATASSGLTVSYTSSNPAVATVSGNTVTIVGVGTTTITASQAGNANYSAATSVPQTLTVNKAGQTITFAALPAKTFGDANFTLGATASSALPVSYTSSNATVATVSGNTVTIVGAGSTTITASQAGNTNYNPASNVPQTLTVNKASQTITFAALPDKTFGDASFALGATASSALPVSYTSSNATVATVSGNTVTIVGAGSTTITASQVGNTNYNPASNVPQTLTVNKASQTITVSPIADKLVTDAPFAVTAITTSGLPLTYAITNGPASVNGNTITLSGSTGTVEVSVNQVGNGNYNSTSSSTSFFVSDPAKSNQTITFAALPAKAYGDASFALGATASSSLAVAYTSSNSAVATISGNSVTITGVGSTTITASQAGDAAFNAAPPVERTLTVSKGSQTITFDAIADKSFGDAAFTLSPTASSSLVVSLEVVNGPVTLSGTEIAITGAGTATIKATQAGNENFNAAPPVERTFTIGKKAQVITIADIEDKLTTDAAFDLVASVDSELELAYSIDGPATLEGVTVTLTGEEGTVTITVSQAGNDNYLAAEATVAFEVTAPEVAEKQEQTITFAAIADKTFGDAAFALEATATSELAVSFEVVSGPATLSGNTVTITGAGTATIRASQSGDETFQAAVAVERSFAIAKKAQTIVVESIGDKLTTDGPIAVNATTDSGLELSYSVTGPASLTGTTLTLTGVEGTVTVTANQVGNDNYLAAEATEAFEVTAPVVKALSISGVASLGNTAFTQGEARLHPKNSNGTFGTPIISALSANGAFTFADVAVGQYALSIASASTAVLTTYFEKATTLANATLLTLSAESIEGIVVDMIEKPSVPGGPGSIAGKLLLSGDGSRHLVTDGRTMEGTPLSGVTILLVSSPGGELIASTVTASDGSFGFSNLPLGAYKLLIDYEGNVSLESPEITISTGQLSFEVASEVTNEGIVIIATPATTTGISAEVLRSMIKAYPNPSQGQFTIVWDGSLADVTEIIVHNNNGSAVWQHPMTAAQLTVDISGQPAGVYFLRLITSHGAAVHKLVIK
jgi:methionine-rich copper-binding protein CopC